MSGRNWFLMTFIVSLISFANSQPAIAQKELFCYRLAKTVYDNGKTIDKSKDNVIRWYLFLDDSDLDDQLLLWADPYGTPLINKGIKDQISRKEQIKSILGLIDDPVYEYQTFVLKEKTKSGLCLYESVIGNKSRVSIRVTQDRTVLNIYYRENKIKNIYATDIYERIIAPEP